MQSWTPLSLGIVHDNADQRSLTCLKANAPLFPSLGKGVSIIGAFLGFGHGNLIEKGVEIPRLREEPWDEAVRPGVIGDRGGAKNNAFSITALGEDVNGKSEAQSPYNSTKC